MLLKNCRALRHETCVLALERVGYASAPALRDGPRRWMGQDILFTKCFRLGVRAHIASSSETCKSGRLRAIFDSRIGAALKAMHDRVENPWTVETLAAAAGMSRSAFALRFKELLGETPLEYLTNWRMYKATGLLQEDDRKLFEVAKSVGYDSDAAFSKAFKRVLGMAPKEYRRSAAQARRSRF